MYQDRFSCVGDVNIRAASDARWGTDMATSRLEPLGPVDDGAVGTDGAPVMPDQHRRLVAGSERIGQRQRVERQRRRLVQPVRRHRRRGIAPHPRRHGMEPRRGQVAEQRRPCRRMIRKPMQAKGQRPVRRPVLQIGELHRLDAFDARPTSTVTLACCAMPQDRTRPGGPTEPRRQRRMRGTEVSDQAAARRAVPSTSSSSGRSWQRRRWSWPPVGEAKWPGATETPWRRAREAKAAASAPPGSWTQRERPPAGGSKLHRRDGPAEEDGEPGGRVPEGRAPGGDEVVVVLEQLQRQELGRDAARRGRCSSGAAPMRSITAGRRPQPTDPQAAPRHLARRLHRDHHRPPAQRRHRRRPLRLPS